MSLSTFTGNYSIYSKTWDAYLGLATFEGSPGAALPVVSIKSATPPPARWSVSQLPNGYYHIAVGGYKAISNSSKLIWAVPEPYTTPPTEWDLQSVPQHGKNAHLIIERGSPWGAWMISDSPGGQVQVTQTIASTPSIPPFFQPNIVLHLDRLD